MTPGLGRGLGALIPPAAGSPAALKRERREAAAGLSPQTESGTYREIPIEKIIANPEQPRRHFDHAALEDLVSSIKEHGVVEPLIVTERGDGTYELIAGERRLRASTIAGLKTVPCVVRTANQKEKLEIALIENIQRHDLNPMEEAAAYQRLIDEFGLTQEDVSKRVGKSRSQVANIVRLLGLPEEIRMALVERKISASNARTLLALPSDRERTELFRSMIAGNFTVRQTEDRVPHPRRANRPFDPNVAALEDSLRSKLGHKVRVKLSDAGRGEIRIGFENEEDLQDLKGKLTG